MYRRRAKEIQSHRQVEAQKEGKRDHRHILCEEAGQFFEYPATHRHIHKRDCIVLSSKGTKEAKADQ